jgi:DNA-binding transcriptional ArsR family regulator
MDAASITRIAGLIGESGRIQMLLALLDGSGHSASELAIVAAVSPQTASSHLSKLVAGGLIACQPDGRRRLFRLASADVAAAIEALGALAPQSGNAGIPELRFARSCYDHLAGVLAIAVRDRLLRTGALRKRGGAFEVTTGGKRFLQTLDIDTDSLRVLRRSFARQCLDWTEREHHLGGAVGAALLSRFLEKRWLARVRQTRALRTTHEGERAFERVFGIRMPRAR